MRLMLIMTLIMPLLALVKAEEKPQFIALGNYDDRNQIMQLRKGMESEVQLSEDREKRLTAMEAKLYSIARERDAEKRLRAYLQLRGNAQMMQSEVKACNERQLKLAGMIDAASSVADNLPQVVTYLGEARSSLQTLGITQQRSGKRLEKLLNGVKLGIRNVPSPAEYSTKSGIRMCLVRADAKSFYISSQPVAPGNITLAEAVGKAREMSKEEGATYRLPSLEEAQILKQKKMLPKCAIWTSTKDEGKSIEENMIRERFGISMYSIWDANKLLCRGEQFAELPSAKYPELGYFVVTDLKTGWRKRWQSLLDKISAEELAP